MELRHDLQRVQRRLIRSRVNTQVSVESYQSCQYKPHSGIRRSIADHVGDVIEPCNPKLVLGGDSCDLEDIGAVNCDSSDTDPLLHNLKPDNQLHAATRVQFSGSDPEEHMKVVLLLGSLPLRSTDVADILEFCLAFVGIGALFATQPSQYIPSLIFAADFDQPPWRLRHEPDDTEEEE